MIKIIGGILMFILPVGSGMHPSHHHKPAHFHCITKGKHHPEICILKGHFPK